jgi:hypothetical protein
VRFACGNAASRQAYSDQATKWTHVVNGFWLGFVIGLLVASALMGVLIWWLANR